MSIPCSWMLIAWFYTSQVCSSYISFVKTYKKGPHGQLNLLDVVGGTNSHDSVHLLSGGKLRGPAVRVNCTRVLDVRLRAPRGEIEGGIEQIPDRLLLGSLSCRWTIIWVIFRTLPREILDLAHEILVLRDSLEPARVCNGRSRGGRDISSRRSIGGGRGARRCRGTRRSGGARNRHSASK